eukprot:COSAG06_NODE_54844_length_292_cov_1.305699_1_plen_55_part_10
MLVPSLSWQTLIAFKHGKLIQKRCVSLCFSLLPAGREGGDGGGITPRTAEAREQE